MKQLFATLLVVLTLPIVAGAQVRLSVDEQSVQAAGGKKMTSERSLYLNADGRLVVEQFLPRHTIALSNTLGEMRLYDATNNEVAVINNNEFASSKEMISIFASGSYVDMALPQYGYTQSSIRSEEGVIVKTFTPKTVTTTAKVELIFQNHLPICMIDYNAKGEEMRKLYFSRYQYERIPLPMRITEIEYFPAKSDSLVRLTTYSNLRFDGDATSELFDFQIPADAKRVEIDPSKLFAQ